MPYHFSRFLIYITVVILPVPINLMLSKRYCTSTTNALLNIFCLCVEMCPRKRILLSTPEEIKGYVLCI